MSEAFIREMIADHNAASLRSDALAERLVVAITQGGSDEFGDIVRESIDGLEGNAEIDREEAGPNGAVDGSDRPQGVAES